jgi:Ran GTPase-activating protein (RanGAP) involved in mRNA processing and transport
MQELHVEGNKFGDSVVPFIVKYLANTDNTLKVFSMGNNGITSAGMEEMALTIGAHNHMTELHCNGNPIGSRGADALMNAVWNTKLNYISLSQCSITECSWASVLIYMSLLETLVLSCNNIDGAGLQDLCEGADRCCSLRHLDLSYNSFRGPQASAIGLLIKKHKGLVTLSLAGVPLSKEMVNNIQLGILGNPTLRVLDLSWCQMGLDLVRPLVVSLAHNALLELKLEYNPIPPLIQESPRTCSIYKNERMPLEKKWTERSNVHVPTNKVIESILATSNVETGVEDVSKLEFAFMNPLHAEAASAIWRKRR